MYWKASFVERTRGEDFRYIYIYIFEQLVSRSFSNSGALNFDTVCHSVPRYPSIPVVCYSDASNYASLMPLTFDERAGEVSSPRTQTSVARARHPPRHFHLEISGKDFARGESSLEGGGGGESINSFPFFHFFTFERSFC